MRYILDGYNVIGQLEGISLSNPKKEALFLDYLQVRADEKDTFFVVFDGKQKCNTFGVKECYDSITYYFTAYGQTADQYIIELMRSQKHPSNTMVVTSDREILYKVKKCHIKTALVDEFKIRMSLSDNIIPTKPEPSADDTDYWLEQMS